MTPRESLLAAMAAIKAFVEDDESPEERAEQINVMCANVIDAHGPALLAALDDAERYRWLRDVCRAEHDSDIAAGIGWRSHANGSLDLWIDAARKA